MDIVERLKIFLKKSAISNSVFADSCKIARPTLSQLLTGRNKKVSDEVVAKIHEAYPQLSIMWLLFGEGPMLASVGPNANTEEMQQVDENRVNPSLFEDTPKNSTASQSTTIDFNDDNQDDFGAQESEILTPSNPLSAMLQSVGAVRSNANGTQASSAKKIVNIMVFYDDNSFDSFVPAKK